MKTSHPEPLKAVHYREKKKQGQISDKKFKKVQAHSSTEQPLEYNQDQMSLTNQGSL